MDQIAISKFKATCLAVLERVAKTRKPVLVTRFGRPVAEIVPPSQPPPAADWLGAMAGTLHIHGDITGPASQERDWKALKR